MLNEHERLERAKTAVGVELIRLFDQPGDNLTFDAQREGFEQKCTRIAKAVLAALDEEG